MPCIHRRAFLMGSAAWLAGTAAAYAFWPFKDTGVEKDIRGRVARGDAPPLPGPYSREAYAYRKLDAGRVVCQVCPAPCSAVLTACFRGGPSGVIALSLGVNLAARETSPGRVGGIRPL